MVNEVMGNNVPGPIYIIGLKYTKSYYFRPGSEIC